MREDFRPILGYEGHYEINSEGVVISVKRGKRKLMKTKKCNKYPRVGLTKDGKQRFYMLHRLVWEAFNGQVPESLCVLHGEGNNYSCCNLEYLSLGTSKENNGRDKHRGKTIARGSKNGSSKLTEPQVIYIKQRVKDGMLLRTLSSLFDISMTNISQIARGIAWSHVT